MRKSLWWACLWRVKVPCSLWWAPPVVILSSGSLKVEQELCVPLSSENMSLVLLWAWKSTNNRTCALIPFPCSFRRAIMGSAETLESSYSILSSMLPISHLFHSYLSSDTRCQTAMLVLRKKDTYVVWNAGWRREVRQWNIMYFGWIFELRLLQDHRKMFSTCGP